jgi:hypothetical protein
MLRQYDKITVSFLGQPGVGQVRRAGLASTQQVNGFGSGWSPMFIDDRHPQLPPIEVSYRSGAIRFGSGPLVKDEACTYAA